MLVRALVNLGVIRAKLPFEAIRMIEFFELIVGVGAFVFHVTGLFG